jgi:hypothetical protein
MRALTRFVRHLGSMLTRQRDEARLQAEIEHHLALQTDDNIRAGMSADEARRQAMLRFGGVQAAKELPTTLKAPLARYSCATSSSARGPA